MHYYSTSSGLNKSIFNMWGSHAFEQVPEVRIYVLILLSCNLLDRKLVEMNREPIINVTRVY